MKKINTLNDLFLEELSDLLSAENQLVKALPKMASSNSDNTEMIFGNSNHL